MAKFALYVVKSVDSARLPVTMRKATKRDLQATRNHPQWQTDWTTDYILNSGFDLYAMKTPDGELVALGAYEVCEDILVVHIVYMESQAESNPTLCQSRKYYGIGRALIAYGIKLSVDAGFNGDVTLDAKTPELAQHYEQEFHAIRLPGRGADSAPRYLICDEAARDIFTNYVEEV